MGDLIQKSIRCASPAAWPTASLLATRAACSAPRPRFLREMYAAMRLGALRPAALVEYDRLAFVHPAETTRVTFDMRLRAAVTGLDLFSPGVMLRPADEATEILEIKFDSCFPAHIRALLAGMTAQRCAISKYVMCRRFENL